MKNRDIINIQNEEEYIDLLKAQRVAYSETKNFHILSVVLVIISMIAPFVINHNIENIYIVIISLFLTLFYLFTENIEKKQTEEAANIQEQFDTKLFDLKWNDILVGNKVLKERIYDLKEKLKDSKDLINWYSPTIDKDLPLNMKILLCQKSNLFWDIGLKRKYIKFMLWLVAFYIAILLGFALYKNMNMINFLIFLSPALPFFIYIKTNYSGLKEQTNNKEQLLQKIDMKLDDYKNNKNLPSNEDIRSIQDAIYQQRVSILKVPDWFYKYYKEKDEIKTSKIIKSVANKL